MIDLNDIAVPKTRHDLAAVKERLACTAADWLPGLFPEARLARDRRSLRCADLSGRPPRKEGSCTIHLDGPYAGWGFDYATGERAGPIDLIAQATGLCDGALFDEAARLAGIDHPAPRPVPASPMRARPDHSAEIARLVGGAMPIAGTPGETYLRARGLSDPGSPDLLFHPDLPDFDSCRGWPGLIAILRLPDGARAPGIHRTFLLDDGSAKAPPGKKMLGSVKDAVVRLFPMPRTATSASPRASRRRSPPTRSSAHRSGRRCRPTVWRGSSGPRVPGASPSTPMPETPAARRPRRSRTA
jgi:putative DNA primase/helicase